MDPGKAGIIKQLDEAVVNRIAAGEIIQRPANSLKELIENSLDAKATVIQICVKNGGLKLLQICDNGTGIRKEDMEIVCKRFTTSKLIDFDDLPLIATFGFRGEALASISHVAHLSIQTKTKSEPTAYKASYVNGELISALTPCAGTQGTIITIEDIFYNMPQRKQALKSPAEEFRKIVDIVMKYAVHNANVSFTLKKQGHNPFIRTMPNSTQKENIKILYGQQIFKELMDVKLKDETLKFTMDALLTKVSYLGKKLIFLLFINHRLVHSSALKTAIDSIYSLLLTKNCHPFVYMNLEIEPKNVDVNIHPTKHEVHFINEHEIIEKIKSTLEETLLSSKTTKKVYKQMKLATSQSSDQPVDTDTVKSNALKPNTFIRTDAKDQKLEKFFIKSQSSKMYTSFPEKPSRNFIEVKLTSVLNMRKKIKDSCSSDLRHMFKNMVFVGVVNKRFSIYQYGMRMFICNFYKICAEFFYQLLVWYFQNFNEIALGSEIFIKDLLTIGYKYINRTNNNSNIEKAVEKASKMLMQKSALLKEYFGLKISNTGVLESIPTILTNHVPDTTFLPIYLLNLATKVNWDTEEECFESFCRQTALFYSSVSNADATSKERKWLVEHVISPAMKQRFLPGNKIAFYIYELTTLPSLYKVFERC